MSINKKRAKVTSLSMPRDKVIKGNHYTVTDFLEILQCSEFMAHVFRKTKWHWIGENLSSCIVLEGNTYKIPADTSLCCLSLEGSVCMFVSCCLYNTGYTTAVYNTTYFTVKKKKKKKKKVILSWQRLMEKYFALCTSLYMLTITTGEAQNVLPGLSWTSTLPGLSTFQFFTEHL